jgi:flagellar basal-body rod protein FlgG
MIRGIYSSAAGMNLQIARMDAVSNNLANAGVPGYKKDRIMAESFPKLIQLGNKRAVPGGLSGAVIGETNQGAAIKQVVTDFSPGMLRETGNDTDFALSGPGFFTLSDPDSGDELYYTRNGNFKLDEEGYLVNGDGYRVMGTGGPIQITENKSFVVDEKGNVTVDGEVSDTLAVAAFDDLNTLERAGNGLFRAPGQEPQAVENPGVMQRYLEGANVDPLEETVNMISAVRAYETGQKIIQAQDGLLDLAINKVGTVR